MGLSSRKKDKMKNYSREIEQVSKQFITADMLLPRVIDWSEKKIDNDIKDPHRIELGFIHINSRLMLIDILREDEDINTKEMRKLVKLMIKNYKKSGFKVTKEMDERGVYFINLLL